jgi:hypothetical protein
MKLFSFLERKTYFPHFNVQVLFPKNHGQLIALCYHHYFLSYQSSEDKLLKFLDFNLFWDVPISFVIEEIRFPFELSLVCTYLEKFLGVCIS